MATLIAQPRNRTRLEQVRVQKAFQIHFYACATDLSIMSVHIALGIIVTLNHGSTTEAG